MKRTLYSLIAISMIILLTGCGTMGSFRANHATVVELSKANYEIVAHNVQGSSAQGYLFGFSGPQFGDVMTFGLVQVSGDKKPYDAAIQDLWNNYEEKYGSMKGKKLALINVRQDTETLNAFIYAEAKYYISADVIEFVD